MPRSKPPFCWCHDEEIPNPLNRALEPLMLTEEEAQELDSLIEHPIAFPTLPLKGIPRRTAAEAPAAPKPQEGEQRTCSWDELLYLLTHGEMGTKPHDWTK